MAGMSQNNIISYAYDNAGNRISRKVVDLNVTPNPLHIKAKEPIAVEEQMGERKITVYPNPTKGSLAVEVTDGESKDEIHILLFSAQGSQLQNKKVKTGTTPVDMTNYASGWYLLRVQAGTESIELKIIKD